MVGDFLRKAQDFMSGSRREEREEEADYREYRGRRGRRDGE
ncbi:hypothetical protein [Nostoc sp. CMAA1605]|nr:hypothetical protein [Nostoc sp. CMAA1605]